MSGIDGILALEGKARYDAILEAKRRVFATPDGQVVLASQLEEHGVLDQAKTEEQMHLQNWGKRLLAELGINSTYALVRALTQSRQEKE